MSASVWEPGSNIINIDAESTNLSQVFSATAAQVTFTLTLFTYTVGAASIAVYRGGQRLIKGVDWSEVDSTHFSITGISLDAGEVIECVAVLGASSANSLASAASAAAASASQVAAGISETNAAASASAATFPWAPESGGIYYGGGSVRIGASGARITGDFSNATVANRTYVQTSTSGGNTSFGLLPHPSNATPITTFEACLSSDPAITSVLQCQITQTDARLNSGSRGGASYLPMTFYTSGIERMRIDTSGNVLVTGSGGLGYSAGSGGTVTQATSKGTAVTLNKPSGKITLNNASLASNTAVTFLVNNSLIGFNDTVVVTCDGGSMTTRGAYQVTCVDVGSGNCVIRLINITAGSLSEAIAINFSIIKGATS